MGWWWPWWPARPSVPGRRSQSTTTTVWPWLLSGTKTALSNTGVSTSSVDLYTLITALYSAIKSADKMGWLIVIRNNQNFVSGVTSGTENKEYHFIWRFNQYKFEILFLFLHFRPFIYSIVTKNMIILIRYRISYRIVTWWFITGTVGRTESTTVLDKPDKPIADSIV